MPVCVTDGFFPGIKLIVAFRVPVESCLGTYAGDREPLSRGLDRGEVCILSTMHRTMLCLASSTKICKWCEISFNSNLAQLTQK